MRKAGNSFSCTLQLRPPGSNPAVDSVLSVLRSPLVDCDPTMRCGATLVTGASNPDWPPDWTCDTGPGIESPPVSTVIRRASRPTQSTWRAEPTREACRCCDLFCCSGCSVLFLCSCSDPLTCRADSSASAKNVPARNSVAVDSALFEYCMVPRHLVKSPGAGGLESGVFCGG